MSEGQSTLRILVVDDDETDRAAVRRALQAWRPHAVIEEAGGMREAAQKLEGGEFHCIILEYLLPEGPCLGFLPRLKEQSNASLIVVTGKGDERIAVELMKAGVADYLSKTTFEPARLVRAVRDAVSVRRAERAAGEAKAEQEHHTEQLRRFVEGAPALASAHTLQDLAHATAELSLGLLEADETFVSLRHGDTEIVARRGHAAEEASLIAWANERRSLLPVSGSRLSGDRLAVALASRDGDYRGVIAAQFSDPLHANQGHLLDQIGVLVSVCSDNIVLYEAASRAIRARDDILAAVSHDLRTPLNNVRLGAGLLRDILPKEGRGLVERIDRSVVHMTHLVDDLVDMVRIEGGKVDLSSRSERVDELLPLARHLIAAQVEAQRITFVVDEPGPQLAVHADRHRTLQVLMNLLGNAVKFTPEGGRVGLAVKDDGEFVRFEVRDSGIGIPEGEGERIFSRFWRSDPTKRRGLGLGLYIAKGLVIAQGGRLWFESTPGEGSRFFFTLPKAAAASP